MRQNFSEVESRLVGIRASCGRVCATSRWERFPLIRGAGDARNFTSFRKEVDCRAIFENRDIDRPSEFSVPPLEVNTGTSICRQGHILQGQQARKGAIAIPGLSMNYTMSVNITYANES